MRKGLFLGGLTFVLLSAGAAMAQSVCYQLGDPDDKTIVRWDVERQARLSTPVEERRFGNPVMTTHRLHGIFYSGFVPDLPVIPLHGSLTSAKGVGTSVAVHAPAYFAAGQFMSFECASEQASPTPFQMTCRFLIIDLPTNAILDPDPDEIVLTRLNPLQEPLCSSFVVAEPGS